jgi:hypothetical protein
LQYCASKRIPLARCEGCGRRIRVLPLELLPRKTYGIDAIELVIRRFLEDTKNYRETAASIVTIGAISLGHSTLHRWITGLGEKTLDRQPSLHGAYPPPGSAVLAQSERMLGVDVKDRYLNGAVEIALAKYRSEHRHDQLKAISKVLAIARVLFDTTYDSLRKWNHLLLPTFFVAVWNFPSGFRGTPMKQAHPP